MFNSQKCLITLSIVGWVIILLFAPLLLLGWTVNIVVHSTTLHYCYCWAGQSVLLYTQQPCTTATAGLDSQYCCTLNNLALLLLLGWTVNIVVHSTTLHYCFCWAGQSVLLYTQQPCTTATAGLDSQYCCTLNNLAPLLLLGWTDIIVVHSTTLHHCYCWAVQSVLLYTQQPCTTATAGLDSQYNLVPLLLLGWTVNIVEHSTTLHHCYCWAGQSILLYTNISPVYFRVD